MARSSKEIKRISRDMLNNRYQIPMGAFVFAGLIPAVLEIPFSMSTGDYPTTAQLIILGVAEFLIFLIGEVLSIGVSYLHLNLTRGKKFQLMDIFFPFRQHTERFFGASFLFSVPVLILSLPAFVTENWIYNKDDISAGSIAIVVGACLFSLVAVLLFTLNYNFATFFLLDSSEKKVFAAFHDARLLMKGRKLRLLHLLFSFLGWSAIALFSFGIAALWIMPYLNQTLVTFYLDCTGELDKIPVRDYRQARTTF